jgi:hypothetical protein
VQARGDVGRGGRALLFCASAADAIPFLFRFDTRGEQAVALNRGTGNRELWVPTSITQVRGRACGETQLARASGR